MASNPETTETPTRADVVRAIVRAAIDTGAACQRLGSFVSAEPGEPMRSVYDVMADQAMEALKDG